MSTDGRRRIDGDAPPMHPLDQRVRAALGDVIAGRVHRGEGRCRALITEAKGSDGSPAHDGDASAVVAALATVAYLHGDFTLVDRLCQRPEATTTPAGPGASGLDRWPSTIPARALALACAGDEPGAATAIAPLAVVAPVHAAALRAIVDGWTLRGPEPGTGHVVAASAETGPAGGEQHDARPGARPPPDPESDPAPDPVSRLVSDPVADPLSDTAVGLAAAAVLTAEVDRAGGSTGPAEPVEAHLAVVAAGVSGGCRLSMAVPVSLHRALAAGHARRGDLGRAAELAADAVSWWRDEQAYVELVEALLLGAEIDTALGRRSAAEQQASEAYALAERLGMLRAKARALSLFHTTTRAGEPSTRGGGLGTPTERVVLMSDVVGSTQVSATEGDEAYYELVMSHHGTVRPLLTDHGGAEFSEGGDSLLAWFEAPEDALDCALAILRATGDARRSGRALSVRVSVAGGEPFFRDGRPYGSVVNRAARLLRRAQPGQLVVDEATLVRLSPVVRGFSSQTIDLGEFGQQAIGFLSP